MAALLVVAPIPLAAWLGTLYAFTEVDPAGLRTRRWTRTWHMTWPEVQKISAQASQTRNGEYQTVLVRATRYRHK